MFFRVLFSLHFLSCLSQPLYFISFGFSNMGETTNIRSFSRKDEWIFAHFQCIVFLPIDKLLIFREEKESKPYMSKLPLAAVLGTFQQKMLAVISCQENTSTFNRLTQRLFVFLFFSAVVFFLQIQENSIFQKKEKKKTE